MAINIEQITIHEAQAHDADDAVRLFGALHRYNAELDPCFALVDDSDALVATYVQQSFHSDQNIWLLARAEGRVVGFVLVEIHSDSPFYKHRRWGEIVGLFVESDYRGSEAADLLMEHAYAWAQTHQLRAIQLYVTASNERAQRFYARHDFDTSQYVMRRTLVPSAPDDCASAASSQAVL